MECGGEGTGRRVVIIFLENKRLRRNMKSVFKYRKDCHTEEADFVLNSAKYFSALNQWVEATRHAIKGRIFKVRVVHHGIGNLAIPTIWGIWEKELLSRGSYRGYSSTRWLLFRLKDFQVPLSKWNSTTLWNQKPFDSSSPYAHPLNKGQCF